MRTVGSAVVFAGILMGMACAIAADDAKEPKRKEVAPEFTKAYLNDANNQAAGKVVWDEQCRHCHGSRAYPGKAPKLKPYNYKPEFVFRRVTYGFEKMPAWIAVYSKEQRMAVVAYILSDDFSP